MRQLTGLDAPFLALETPRQSGLVSGLAVLDPSTRPNGRLELADVQNMIAERPPLLPPFRWRLKQVPLALDYPYWIDDLDFDFSTTSASSRCRRRPPTPSWPSRWRESLLVRSTGRARSGSYLIHGLQDGNVALLTKIHQAAVDGISGAEIMSALLDLTPREQMRDVWKLIGWLREALDELRPSTSSNDDQSGARASEPAEQPRPSTT